ncbi:DUF4153 domain-containing protein [Sphingomonas sp. PAMC 26605]|uniref:DUF4153 domain-containing protein n=1 Tax=Sphingomonas sp. PAMC 26605 TaxID=1112214 RepID=UPI00026CDDBC|nr:DUF4153 domain-containing protein [Sphingomonas sp. PAMC 26605]
MEESTSFEDDTQGWPLRPALLALIGALAALAVHQVSGSGWVLLSAFHTAAWRIALTSAITAGALTLGFTLERRRRWWAATFGVGVGVIAGLIVYWNGWGAGAWWSWPNASLYLAIAIAVPLFQTVRDQGAWRFPYADVHGDAWTNAVLWGACWLFTGVTFALAWLLADLFYLIGLHALRDLLQHGWFSALVFGTSFGGALGLLRERDGVVRQLQRVVTAVLGVLAPVLGVALAVFLLSLPFTGLDALWEATKSTTPTLLGCVLGALLLANAVIGNGETDEASNPVLRLGALALALAVLPLAVIAAIATGLRIGQYGLTPDRLWALVFVTFACAYGLAYLVAVVRGRTAWADYVRPSNVRLALIVAGAGLLLATPIASFNALSSADQVARLESGRVAPAKFDWTALAFDFGDPGKAALRRLAQSRTPAIASRAREISTKTSRWDITRVDRTQSEADLLVKRLRVLPAQVPVPLALRTVLTDWRGCSTDRNTQCLLLYTPGANEAVSLSHSCIDDLTRAQRPPRGAVAPVIVPRSSCGASRYRRTGESWARVEDNASGVLSAAERAALTAGAADGKVEIRAVPARRVFVGGVPVGDPFE